MRRKKQSPVPLFMRRKSQENPSIEMSFCLLCGQLIGASAQANFLQLAETIQRCEVVITRFPPVSVA